MNTPRRVTVVGGGVIGLCTAYYLRQAGLEVTVLERDSFGAGASAMNAGWICPSLAGPLAAPGMPMLGLKSLLEPGGSFRMSPKHFLKVLPWLTRFWGKCNPTAYAAGLRATARLGANAMELYDGLASDGVDFEMQRGSLLFVALRDETVAHYLEDMRALEEFGYSLPSSLSSGVDLRGQEPALSDAVVAGFAVDGERSVLPESLMKGLTNRLAQMDVGLHDHMEVNGVTASRAGVGIDTSSGAMQSDAVVIAAGVWTAGLLRGIGVKLPMEAGKGHSASVSPSVVPRQPLYLTEAKVGATPFGSRLRLAGTMELAGIDPTVNRGRLGAMVDQARSYLNADLGPLHEERAGLRPVTADALPAIGQVRPNVFIATGHSMLGITLGPSTGQALAEAVVSGEPPAQLEAFKPSRF